MILDNFILNSLILTFVIVYIIDISGFITSLSKFIFEWLNPKSPWMGQLIPKPFSCAVCMSFWVTLIYALFYTNVVYSLLIATVSSLLVHLIKFLISLYIRAILSSDK